MTTPSSWPFIAFCGLIGTTSLLRGEQVVIHTGPPAETPASSPVTPFPESETPKLIKFQREFFMDRELLASLPDASSVTGTVPVTAVEAIKRAMKDIDPGGGLRTHIVTEVRLLKGPANVVRQIEYYLISTLANGSEVHRVVLMDGQVLSSKLRAIKE